MQVRPRRSVKHPDSNMESDKESVSNHSSDEDKSILTQLEEGANGWQGSTPDPVETFTVTFEKIIATKSDSFLRVREVAEHPVYTSLIDFGESNERSRSTMVINEDLEETKGEGDGIVHMAERRVNSAVQILDDAGIIDSPTPQTIFAQYLHLLSRHVNAGFFEKVVFHILLYFECLNTPGYKRVDEPEQALNDDTTTMQIQSVKMTKQVAN